MNEFETEMRGRIIALSYLAEIALGSILAQNPDRVATLERLRFDWHTQLRSDHAATGPASLSPNADPAVVRVAGEAIDIHVARLIAQFENPAPPRHRA